MSLPKRITLIRHGESVWNAAGRWQGHGDAPLSEVGQQQALALGRRLRGHTFARIESSDLQRAVDTARAFGSPVQASIWRELDVGLWEGLSDAEVREQFPEELQALRKDPTQKWGRHGESLEDLRKRARQAFDALVARLAPGEEAAVVCHGGLLLSLVTDLLGMPDRFPRPIGRFGNTSITCHRGRRAGSAAPDPQRRGPRGRGPRPHPRRRTRRVCHRRRGRGRRPQHPGRRPPGPRPARPPGPCGRAPARAGVVGLECDAGWVGRLMAGLRGRAKSEK
jgi:broad specificity phosphatase PhoE